MAEVPRDPSGVDTQAAERVDTQNEPVATNTAALETHDDSLAAGSDLLSIGLVEFLELEERPVFILDLASASKTTPVYCNPSLREIPFLQVKISREAPASSASASRDPRYHAFLSWVVSTQQYGSSAEVSYCSFQWTSKTIRKRWQIISGDMGQRQASEAPSSRRQSEMPQIGRSQTSIDEFPERSQSNRHSNVRADEILEAQLAAFRAHRETFIQTSFPAAPATERSERIGRWDITRPCTSVSVSEHVQYILDLDWASTELGPMDSWSPTLRRMVNLMMVEARPTAMFWGNEMTMIYNEAYRSVTGDRHTRMMGKPFSVAWEEIAGDFIPAFNEARDSGAAYVVNDAQFYIERHGYLEETYYSLSIVPFDGDNGEVAFYNPVFDTTRQVIADRRTALLLRLGQYISSSSEPGKFWQQLLLALQADHLDVPFAALYSAGGDINETLSESSGFSQNLRNWVLEGLVRVPDTCPGIPKRLTSEKDMEEFVPNFPQLVKAESPTLLSAENGTLPDFVVKDIGAMQEVACQNAVFLSIRSTGDNILGFLILGLNPRRQFDDDYKVFIELMSRQLNTSIASAVLLEDEIRRGRMAAEAAAHDRSLLSKKLAIQTHEALELENRFRRMADLAPVGMFHIDTEGTLVYGNEHYYNLTEHPLDLTLHSPFSWYDVIAKEDHPIMDHEWAKLFNGQTVSFELKLKRPFVTEDAVCGEKVEGPTWIIAAAYPELSQDGSIVGVLGCLTDISRQKWMEGLQKRKMLEAVELKRQQENFIDVTSHEMRNPLSAIIQCADFISTRLAEFEGDSQDVTLSRETVDGYVDAAQTIVLCAQHQKRIIDDVLTLSKIDSNLLLITPAEVQPVFVVQRALKIFETELQKSDMGLRFCVDSSYSKLSVDWVLLDPSRLLQVLLNLITNAIKFTQTERERKLTITLGASLNRPSNANGIEYLPRRDDRKDMSVGRAWGTADVVFLSVEVKDTGCGLNEHEKNLLFKRFSQASPRTHVQYGGSGLGLFISRELTELQGGQIGVASSSGEGSTFAFYVRARRCIPPEGYKPAHADRRLEKVKLAGRSASHTQTHDALPSPKGLSKGEPRHILIVEDNLVNQKVLSKQLRSAGCIVSVANHGREALAFLSTTHFWHTNHLPHLPSTNVAVPLDIVLMDLEMPVMDGLTCVKKIRELQKTGEIRGHVPVIAVTANARSEQIATAKESGMDSVVTKPFRILELMPELEKQVARGRERGESAWPNIDRSASAPL